MSEGFHPSWDSQEVLDKHRKNTIKQQPHWGLPPKSNWARIYFTAKGGIRPGRKAQDNCQVSKPTRRKKGKNPVAKHEDGCLCSRCQATKPGENVEAPGVSMATSDNVANVELRQVSEEAEETNALSAPSPPNLKSESKPRLHLRGSPAGPPELSQVEPGSGSDYKEMLGAKRKRVGDDEGGAPIADQGEPSTTKVVHQEQAPCNSEALASPRGSTKKSWQCDRCEKSFGRREHLTRHIRTVHEGGFVAQCGECGRTFSRRDNGLKHVEKCPKICVRGNLIDLPRILGASTTLAGQQPAEPQGPDVDPAPGRDQSSNGTTSDEEIVDAEVDDRPRGKSYPGTQFTSINRAP